MSASAKANLGHKRRLTHEQKVAMMKRMIRPYEAASGVMLRHSLNWRRRQFAIQQRVHRREIRAKYHSEVRKGLRGQKEQVA